ncbi:MAG: heterodisulfide reductase-related iron-sulfur binding cluster [candidate division NC10 bacterium]|nr:4Fe-4S dicluster domain-containing protein [candidate division NC10 bacterium]MCZ6549908.1 heterodisulfide reductase-related iron-sulfur binding cluster [candidate division NC10 bacterium]
MGQPTAEKTGARGFDHIDPPDTEIYLDCVHCGFCLPTCPTYLVLGNEMDNPRGRIYLMRAVDEGKAKITDRFVEHMNLCVLCRACETACPSGVKFGFIMEAARGQIERNYQYPPKERRFRKFILDTFTDLGRMSTLTSLLRFYQKLGLQKLARSSGVLGFFGRLGKMEALLPPIPDRQELPEVMPAKGEKRGRVGLLMGCAQRFFLPQVNEATARVLAENGFEVVIPKDQACCGSLLVHEGERERGKGFARKTIDVFERASVDFIVVNAAGCGSVMKEYWELLHNDPVYRERAEAFSKKVRDASELIAQADLNGRLRELKLKVTYHDACHLAHGQKVRLQPRKILKAIPGVQLVELAESDFCCGSAGVYNLLEPDVAQKFLDRKIDRIKETGAEVVVSANPGCTFQIEKGLKEQGLNIRVLHPMEVLDGAYQGTIPPQP